MVDAQPKTPLIFLERLQVAARGDHGVGQSGLVRDGAAGEKPAALMQHNDHHRRIACPGQQFLALVDDDTAARITGRERISFFTHEAAEIGDGIRNRKRGRQYQGAP